MPQDTFLEWWFDRSRNLELAAGDVLFVHGLGGDAIGTWSHGGQAPRENCWPAWLARDLPAVSVSSVNYDAAATFWSGHGMPLRDRAVNVLTRLEAEGFGPRPIVFICHSLGGLLVKQLVRQAHDMADTRWKDFRQHVRSIFFLATPHAGADLAGLLRKIALVARPTEVTEELEANSAQLANLNDWYRQNARRVGIASYCYYEARRTHGIQVVDRASADPGMEGVILEPIDADHLSICKLETRDHTLYKAIVRHLTHDLELPKPERDGFVSESGVRNFIQKYEQLSSNEPVTAALKILRLIQLQERHNQNLWLVSTTSNLYCVSDDVFPDDTIWGAYNRPPGLKIHWCLNKANARPIKARDRVGKMNTAYLDIGPRQGWLYSTKLFPTHQDIENAVHKLI
jgi:hypothetical protein